MGPLPVTQEGLVVLTDAEDMGQELPMVWGHPGQLLPPSKLHCKHDTMQSYEEKSDFSHSLSFFHGKKKIPQHSPLLSQMGSAQSHSPGQRTRHFGSHPAPEHHIEQNTSCKDAALGQAANVWGEKPKNKTQKVERNTATPMLC